MIKGTNLIGVSECARGEQFLTSYNIIEKKEFPEKFVIATKEEVNLAVEKASSAYETYRRIPGKTRAEFLETIADEIMALGDKLIERASTESGLPAARLTGERGRTVHQLKLFAELLREGSWVEAVIDTAIPDRKPLPRADIRKMLVPIGPVVVFGASNFPLAFSTAGGDTVSVLAGGNPVIVKAHQSHLGTNEMVGRAILQAAFKCKMPDGVFSYVVGKGSETGISLVTHEGVKAVGFTGSQNAGMSIYKAAVNEREVPIPVYAEMSSINPVLVLPGRLRTAPDLAKQVAASVVLGVGQFCTNPGLIFLMENDDSERFINSLKDEMALVAPAVMLNPGICKSYHEGKEKQKQQPGVEVLHPGEDHSADHKGAPYLSRVSAADFHDNPALQKEVFGPSTLVVTCRDKADMHKAIEVMEGQLTGTVLGEDKDLRDFVEVIDLLADKVGRILFNGVPTGVEVGYAMVHGGPFPATTNANSTSVGMDAIRRFMRPLCFQDCPVSYLPPELQNNNPLEIMRRVNGVFTRDAIS